MFTSKDIQERTGLNKMQVWRMVEYGIITPTENPKGRGKVRRFNDINLAEFLIAQRLYELRAEPGQIWSTLDKLRRWKLYSRETGEVKYKSFWEYIRSAEYRKWREKNPEAPIYLTLTRDDTIVDPPAKTEGIYRAKEIESILARCHAAVIVNLLPIVNEVFF